MKNTRSRFGGITIAVFLFLLPISLLYCGHFYNLYKLDTGTHLFYLKNSKTLWASGAITPSFNKKIMYVINHHDIENLIITSSGGFTDSATNIGKMVAKNNIKVIAFSACLSACTEIWAAASARELVSDSYLGFHYPSNYDPLTYMGDTKVIETLLLTNQKKAAIKNKINKDFQKYLSVLRQAGAGEYFVDDIQEYRDSNMLWCNNKCLLDAGFEFGSIDFNLFKESYFGVNGLKQLSEVNIPPEVIIKSFFNMT